MPVSVEALKYAGRFLPVPACQPPAFWNACSITFPGTHLIWEITTLDFRQQQSIWGIHSYSSSTSLQWCLPPPGFLLVFQGQLESVGHPRTKISFWGRRLFLHFMNQKFGDRESKSALSEAVIDLTWKAPFGFPASLLMKKGTGPRGRIQASLYSYLVRNDIREAPGWRSR